MGNWSLRLLSNPYKDVVLELDDGQHILGSDDDSDLVIVSDSVLAQHICLHVDQDTVELAALDTHKLKTFWSNGNVVVEKRAFHGSNIETFHVEKKLVCHDKAFHSCKYLHTIVSDHLTLAGAEIFAYCSELANVPDMECSMENGGKNLGMFRGCLKLTHDPCHGRWGPHERVIDPIAFALIRWMLF